MSRGSGSGSSSGSDNDDGLIESTTIVRGGRVEGARLGDSIAASRRPDSRSGSDSDSEVDSDIEFLAEHVDGRHTGFTSFRGIGRTLHLDVGGLDPDLSTGPERSGFVADKPHLDPGFFGGPDVPGVTTHTAFGVTDPLDTSAMTRPSTPVMHAYRGFGGDGTLGAGMPPSPSIPHLTHHGFDMHAAPLDAGEPLTPPTPTVDSHFRFGSGESILDAGMGPLATMPISVTRPPFGATTRHLGVAGAASSPSVPIIPLRRRFVDSHREPLDPREVLLPNNPITAAHPSLVAISTTDPLVADEVLDPPTPHIAPHHGLGRAPDGHLDSGEAPFPHNHTITARPSLVAISAPDPLVAGEILSPSVPRVISRPGLVSAFDDHLDAGEAPVIPMPAVADRRAFGHFVEEERSDTVIPPFEIPHVTSHPGLGDVVDDYLDAGEDPVIPIPTFADRMGLGPAVEGEIGSGGSDRTPVTPPVTPAATTPPVTPPVTSAAATSADKEDWIKLIKLLSLCGYPQKLEYSDYTTEFAGSKLSDRTKGNGNKDNKNINVETYGLAYATYEGTNVLSRLSADIHQMDEGQFSIASLEGATTKFSVAHRGKRDLTQSIVSEAAFEKSVGLAFKGEYRKNLLDGIVAGVVEKSGPAAKDEKAVIIGYATKIRDAVKKKVEEKINNEGIDLSAHGGDIYAYIKGLQKIRDTLLPLLPILSLKDSYSYNEDFTRIATELNLFRAATATTPAETFDNITPERRLEIKKEILAKLKDAEEKLSSSSLERLVAMSRIIDLLERDDFSEAENKALANEEKKIKDENAKERENDNAKIDILNKQIKEAEQEAKKEKEDAEKEKRNADKNVSEVEIGYLFSTSEEIQARVTLAEQKLKDIEDKNTSVTKRLTVLQKRSEDAEKIIKENSDKKAAEDEKRLGAVRTETPAKVRKAALDELKNFTLSFTVDDAQKSASGSFTAGKLAMTQFDVDMCVLSQKTLAEAIDVDFAEAGVADREPLKIEIEKAAREKTHKESGELVKSILAPKITERDTSPFTTEEQREIRVKYRRTKEYHFDGLVAISSTGPDGVYFRNGIGRDLVEGADTERDSVYNASVLFKGNCDRFAYVYIYGTPGCFVKVEKLESGAIRIDSENIYRGAEGSNYSPIPVKQSFIGKSPLEKAFGYQGVDILRRFKEMKIFASSETIKKEAYGKEVVEISKAALSDGISFNNYGIKKAKEAEVKPFSAEVAKELEKENAEKINPQSIARELSFGALPEDHRDAVKSLARRLDEGLGGIDPFLVRAQEDAKKVVDVGQKRSPIRKTDKPWLARVAQNIRGVTVGGDNGRQP